MSEETQIQEEKRPLEGFRKLGLSEVIIDALKAKGFEEPSPIQEKSVPLLLDGARDVIGQAQTGTGKTAAFGLPIIDILEKEGKYVKAIVLTPTRELAIQVSDEMTSFKGKKRLNILPVYGGSSIDRQISSLKRGVDIVVGTPGRIKDHIERGTLRLDQLEFFVLDEADEMLNMGFLEDIEEILKVTNEDKRMLFFSATMPDQILKLAKSFMRSGYEVLRVKAKELTTNLTDQIYLELRREHKFEALCRIIDIEAVFYGIVFCRTKNDVDEVSQKLSDRGYDAAGLHGDISQSQREKVLNKFRKKRITILVATDVAARGIDVQDISHVINYSLPQDPESYVHRIGRTGRAGKEGTAITFITPSEYRKLSFIQRIAKAEIRKESVPKVKDIIKVKRERLFNQIQEISQKPDDLADFMEIANTLLEGQDPALVIASVLKHSFADELNKDNYNDIESIRGRRDRDRDRGDRRRDDRGDRRRDRRDRRRGERGERGERNGIRKEKCRLFIALGKKDQMTKRSLVDFIMDETNVPPRLIDDVQVMDAFFVYFCSIP